MRVLWLCLNEVACRSVEFRTWEFGILCSESCQKVSEGVSWHLMRTRVGSIVQTCKFVLIPKRYLSFSWWVSVCLYATVRFDGSCSVRMIRSVRTYTRGLLISKSRAFLAIIFANYLTRYLGLCHSDAGMSRYTVREPNMSSPVPPSRIRPIRSA